MAKLREASFKGVAFNVEQADGEVGRRTVLHEFPFRDLPQGEDLGRAARRFNVTALFVGPDAVDRAKQLLDVLERPDAGILVHPWHGSHLVQLSGNARVRWPRFAGGRVSIELPLVEAGETPADAIRPDTDAQLASACDAAQAATDADLDKDFLAEIDGYLDEAIATVDAACAAVESFLAPVQRAEAQLDRLIAGVNHIINAPLQVAAKLSSRISNVLGKLTNPFSGMSAWKKLLRGQNPWALPKSGVASSSRPAWASSTAIANGTALPAMPPSLAHWVRRTLVIEAVRAIPTASFTSKAEIAAARQTVLAQLATEANAAPDNLFPALQELRAAAAVSLQARLPTALEVTTLETQATLPALVLAYKANGTLDAADDLVARNGVKHPGFVPAGSVEVLRDG
ncbi:DNA circularization protein [Gulbenkiania mobilis]|uniref:DNA circularization protein n=1 Tax=Gulbenkiania mobilis TaxID=397457 RepID=UPI0006BBED02|nr:DNA circularization N-terminal domain-containing protein [Gulbenkiania mobilis]